MNFQVPDGFVHDDKIERFITHVGPIYEKWQGKQLTCAFLAEQHHVNKRGFVHGGMLSALADHTYSMMVWAAAGQKSCTTISLNSDFTAAGRIGDWIECAGEVTRLTRSLVFIRGRVSTAERVLMTASGVWKRLGGG